MRSIPQDRLARIEFEEVRSDTPQECEFETDKAKDKSNDEDEDLDIIGRYLVEAAMKVHVNRCEQSSQYHSVIPGLALDDL